MHADRDDQAENRGHTRSNRSRTLLFVAIAALLVIGFGLLARQLLKLSPPEQSAAPQTTVPQPPAPESAANRETERSVPDTVEDEPPAEVSEPPLPELEHSDPEVRASLSDILPAVAQPSLQPNDVLRRAIVMIDAVARGNLLRDKLPLPVVGGKLIVTTRGTQTYLSSENYSRYDSVIDAFAELDAAALGAWFDRYEPLFRAAYAELGNGDTDVRKLLLSGIDLMLGAPEPSDEIELVQPGVFYKFADPTLEALPSSSKLLIRMGPRNRAIVIERLQRLRKELARS